MEKVVAFMSYLYKRSPNMLLFQKPSLASYATLNQTPRADIC